MPGFNSETFQDVDVIFGVVELEGFADGDVVTITPEADQFSKLVGAKGDVGRAQSSDSSVAITVRLLHTSPSNKTLMDFFNADRETGAGTQPMIIINKETGKLTQINNAWITKYPEEILGVNVTVMEWMFHGDFMTKNIA